MIFSIGTRVKLTEPVLIIPAGATGKIRAFLTPDLVTVEIDAELVPKAMGRLVGVPPRILQPITAKICQFPNLKGVTP